MYNVYWNYISDISRHDAPILNDKYFPKSGFHGSTANMLDTSMAQVK